LHIHDLARLSGSRSLVVFAALALAAAPGAQNARVVACNSANGRILEVDFVRGASTVLVADNTRVSMQSCVFRDDGAKGLHLLVADRNGEVVFYPNGAGPGAVVLANTPGHPANPNGLSQDPRQNLYGVTSSTGSSTASVPKVWMLRRDPAGGLPGGYAEPVGWIDSDLPGVQELAESILVTSNLGALRDGDLLVLVSAPPMILRYRATELAAFRDELASGATPAELTPEVFVHAPDALVPAGRRFPAGVTPQGMCLTQEGDVLISAGEGRILHWLADGNRRTDGAGGFLDFAAGLGNGQFKLATGFQDGALRVFLTDRNGGEVHRFGFALDHTGVLEKTVSDSESPNGIATTTAALEPTPAGAGIVVHSSDLMVSTIENVDLAGFTSITEYVFQDPRESEPGAPADPSAPLHRALDLNAEISSLLPAGVTVPAHVRAFRHADPVTGAPTGPATFALLVAASSAGVQGTIQHIAEESFVLGYEPDCMDANPRMRPKLFWRDNPATGEAPIPEGDFINITNDCGSSRGLTKSYSLFLPGRDTRSLDEIFAAQLTGLIVALDGATCVRNKTLKAMQRQAIVAQREYFERARPDKALAALQSLVALAEAAPGDFGACLQNEGGDIRARAAAGIYTLETR